MIPVALLAPLRRRIAADMGLSVAGRGWADLDRRIAEAARDAGATDAEAYIETLVAGPLSDPEVHRLARFLTVGETYLFRDRAAFDALEQRVLPELLQACVAQRRRLRIWSAGCCTGEEPYSLAILLDRLLPDARDNSVEILATDVNPQFLDDARRARFGSWSFRGVDAGVRARYFNPAGDGAFDLDPRIRDRVRFQLCNLADGRVPAGSFDLIVCRNVLMYFTPKQMRAVAARFHTALRDDGYLLVSPAETSSNVFPQFAIRNVGDAAFYASTRPPEPQRAVPASTPTPVAPKSLRVPEIAPSAAELAARARSYADAGRLGEAAAACEQAIAADKLAPAIPYLLATIEIERQRPDAAITALRRALFLDPGFVLAHVALANVLLGAGRRAAAARALGAARAALRDGRAGVSVAEAGGLTAARIAEVVDTLSARLAGETVV